MSRQRRRNRHIHEMERLYTERAYSDIEMAERLGIDRSNVFKIRQLMETELGVPFYEESRGRYRIDPRRRISHIPLNPQETLALYLGARRLQQQTRTGQQDVASALEKLARALCKPLAESLVQAARAVLEQEQDTRQEKVLATLVEGWLQGLRVRIHHRKLHGQLRTYTVGIYQIEPAVWGDGVYLVGHSDYHGDLATFKVSRIEQASLTTERYTAPADFDIHKLLKHAWGIWHADADPVTVRLRFSRQVTPRVKESIWHPSQTIRSLDDGGCIWEAEIAEWQEMEPWVRGWGSQVEVLEPAELREEIMADVQHSSRKYGLVALSQSPDDRLLRLWGKTVKGRESEYHPALYHMLDVAHVAQQLLRPQASPRWRNVLAAALNADADTLPEWLPWLIALHDIGKISVPFQAQNDAQRQRLKEEGFEFGYWGPSDRRKLHHTVVGRIVLKNALQHLPTGLQMPLLEMVGGHHGLYQSVSGVHREDFEGTEEPAEWAALRRRAMQLLGSILLQNEPTPWPEPAHLSAAIVALNGFTILCDWLGSDEAYFKPAAHLSLIDYLPRSRQRAQERVRTAGFFEHVRSDRPTVFGQLFAEIGAPRPLQQAIDLIPAGLLAQPSLTIIEAPTGEGKTEAALALAHRLAVASGSDELYIALPTMATSNAMYERLQEHVRDRLGLPLELVQLVHGQNFLVRDDLRIEPLGNGDEETHPALTWLQPKRKALLAPFGVGTVDQAELSALNVRFNALRLIGLAGKVVVLDEVHAYDAYMLAIIERMVQWLSAVGSSVILLSATLPKATRRRLAQAYNEAAVLPEIDGSAGQQDYPSLLVTGRSQPIPHHTFPAAFQPHKTIHLQTRNMKEEAWEEKARWLLDAAGQGGCVCWIANTVDRAQQIYGALQKLLESEGIKGIECTLLHARFPLADRQETEQAVLEKYGKGREKR
ncbi:MAG: CRISPR-associated helicase Cas3', partial [Chloroflexi bacterium]|nr:CRISPR-associated helicase Cas3' [Chloroflexota bacterium]